MLQKYKYQEREWQDELGLGWYDYGARNYDPALCRWVNIDPLAEKRYEITPYNYVQNSPLYRIDPDGRTDYTLNKKTGEVRQVGEANDKPDRIVKTNRKGEVKTNSKGEAKVAIDNIEQGILRDGMNFKNNDNMISIGSEGQPSEAGVESFALALSNYISREIGGAYFSKDGVSQTTHITLGMYKDNDYKNTKVHGHNLRTFINSIDELNRYNLKVFFHTHPSGIGITADSKRPSIPDVESSEKARKFRPNLNIFIITNHPPYKFSY